MDGTYIPMTFIHLLYSLEKSNMSGTMWVRETYVYDIDIFLY